MEEDVKPEQVGQETTQTESSPVVKEDPALEGTELIDDPSADEEIAEELAKEDKEKDSIPG